jgi:hypothetical protein
MAHSDTPAFAGARGSLNVNTEALNIGGNESDLFTLEL